MASDYHAFIISRPKGAITTAKSPLGAKVVTAAGHRAKSPGCCNGQSSMAALP
jgi:hypothetical protein